ncbi:MAG: DNA gyrase inhibitor YacG [Planctomycetota bacterium]
MSTYQCATCRTSIEYEGKLPDEYPFCGIRCRMVDLGLWFREAYSIDHDLTEEGLADEQLPAQPPPAPE